MLAVAVEGYPRAPLNPLFRLVALVGALALIFPGWTSDAIGAVIAVLLFLIRPGATSGRDTSLAPG
ncbi:hypothetical protein ACS8Y6_16035 [Salinisphaera sp. RV14]|uniref:hypothetical protein n=1 Tax=unclassified Salinisphaera TaxID=2649847 RepID=UPI003F852774